MNPTSGPNPNSELPPKKTHGRRPDHRQSTTPKSSPWRPPSPHLPPPPWTIIATTLLLSPNIAMRVAYGSPGGMQLSFPIFVPVSSPAQKNVSGEFGPGSNHDVRPSPFVAAPVVAAQRPCTVAGPPGITTAFRLTILGAVGVRRPVYCTHDPVFGEVCGIARFAAGGRRALLELPAAQANASARPRGFSYAYAVAIRRNRQTSPLEAETIETAISDFLAGRWRRAALDCHPPL